MKMFCVDCFLEHLIPVSDVSDKLSFWTVSAFVRQLLSSFLVGLVGDHFRHRLIPGSDYSHFLREQLILMSENFCLLGQQSAPIRQLLSFRTAVARCVSQVNNKNLVYSSSLFIHLSD